MPKLGRVTLIGAGPGDPGLFTLRGLEELQQADTVLFDRLVGEEILKLIPPDARRIDVGKQSGNHTLPQAEINTLLVTEAKAGKRVVRLKGGDPYLFGRGGEELEQVVAQNIPFSVIPGITSALAVPAWAGIPVTHRDHVSSVHIITGHGKEDTAPRIDFQSLVATGGTLVFLMGVSALEHICRGLLEAGLSGDMSAALIQNGTRPNQRKLLATVSQISARAREEEIGSPAVLVVGTVCALSPNLDWVSRQPLWGKTVLVTRPQSGRCRLGDKLEALGCQVLRYPAIALEPLETKDIWPTISQYSWVVFTSAYGVNLFFQNLKQNKVDIRSLAGIQFAAIGIRTAQAVEEHGILVEYLPDVYDAAHLAQGLTQRVQPGQQVLLYRAEAGTRELPETLSRQGIAFTDTAAYSTIEAPEDSESLQQMLSSQQVDLITFTSASTVSGFMQAVGAGFDTSVYTAVCIGEQTAACARAQGFCVIVSETATFDSMVDTILEHLHNQMTLSNT